MTLAKEIALPTIQPSDENWVKENLPTITRLSQEPVKWVVDRFHAYGCLTMLVGAQGSMKSLLATYLAQAVAGHIPGRTFLGRKVMHGIPVLFVDRENPECEVSNRARHMGIMGNANFFYWGDFLKGSHTPEPDDPRIMAFAERHNGLVIFDSLQDWYGNENENDNSAMVKLMGRFRDVARAGAGVFLLHHLNAAGLRGRGGTSIVNLTDMAIKSKKTEDDPNVVELREERFRMGGAWEMDFRAHWDAGAFHNYQKFYQLELLRDQEVKDVMRDRKAAMEEDRRKKANSDAEDTAQLVAEARESGNALSTIANKLSISRKRAENLFKAAGLTWDKDLKTWSGFEDE